MQSFEKIIFVTIGGYVSWLVGGWSVLLTVLFILNLMDHVTGIAANWGRLASRPFVMGVFRKVMIWVWVVIANLIQIVLVEQGVQMGFVIRDAVVLLFVVGEVISINENSAKLGLPMPGPIKKALGMLDKKEGEEDK